MRIVTSGPNLPSRSASGPYPTSMRSGCGQERSERAGAEASTGAVALLDQRLGLGEVSSILDPDFEVTRAPDIVRAESAVLTV